MFANLGVSSRTEMHIAGMFLHGKSAQIKKNMGDTMWRPCLEYVGMLEYVGFNDEWRCI